MSSGAILIMNGMAHQDQSSAPLDLQVILQAIEAIYNPRSTNEIRHAANQLLEDTKGSPQARELGFSLALDTTKDATLRHYGLTLLDYHIRFVWDGYDEEMEAVLRNNVVTLAQHVRSEDPSYLRNKVAHEWTVFAKRSWATYWMNMDEQLVELFQASDAHREIVLYILQTLAEDIFKRDDSLAAARSETLAAACIEIFTPEALMLDDGVPKTGHVVNVRFGSEGWLQRLSTFLEWGLNNNNHAAAVKNLTTLGSALGWMPSATIAETAGIQPICRAMLVGDAAIRLAAIEALSAICGRDKLADDDVVKIVTPLYASDSVASLRAVYRWAVVDAHDIDDQKYLVLQKLAKLLTKLGLWIEKRPSLVPDSSDLPSFFELLFEVAKDISLKVSEPVLHLWAILLRSRALKDSPVIQQSIGALMEMCSQRLVRYESLPEDSNDPTLLFLENDFDTIPEKHAFLGNYRRYCVEVVEAVVRKFPVDAVNHILGQAETLFREMQQELASFQPQHFSKKSTPFLRVDAQVLLVDAAVKGYNKYLDHQDETDPQQNEATRNGMLSTFVQFYETSLAMEFNDPAVQRRVLSSLVGMVIRVLRQPRPDLAILILQRLLKTDVREDPSLPDYSEAVRGLSYLAVTESQKLATYLPNQLFDLYDELESTIQHMHATRNYDEAHRLGFNAFLFIIILKAKDLDEPTRMTKLREMMQESTTVWTNQEFTESAKGFESFLTILGLGPLPEYLYSHNFHKIQDWGDNFLDAEGTSIQANVNDRMEHIPHRATRTLLMATFDKLQETDPIYETAISLWAEAMPTILPTLMQTLRHVHAFGDRSSWSQLPDEMQHVMQRILTDRFWQAGISTESMEDFYARVNSSKNSYEGFASTIRGALRQVREKSYSILCYLARLNEKFYGLPDLPDVIANAVYGTVQSLSSHQTTVLVNMSSQLIGRCPVELRSSFLPPVLIALFEQLDRKLNTEWAAVVHRTSQANEGDNLGDEMKSESILRLLTFNAVSVANSLLDIDPSLSQNDPILDSRMHKMILATPQVLGQILVFLTSALRFRDTRSCNTAIQIFGRTIPFFNKPSEVQSYICDNVLKAAITSFNEPYFVDAQKNLASLIAQIISMDSEGGVPRSIILSLPGLSEERVDKVIKKVRASKSAQQGGSAILGLLSGLRGVSIHELGKIERPVKIEKVVSGMDIAVDDVNIRRGGEEELEGVAGMFG